jgi:hypothetical protein
LKKVNIVTYPDQLYDDNYEILLLYPSQTVLSDIQSNFLAKYEDDVNLYLYDKQDYVKEEMNWLLTTLKCVNTVIVDVDNAAPFFREMLSFVISKNKTYWLTNAEHPVYNHISKCRIYDLDFLLSTGEISEKAQ